VTALEFGEPTRIEIPTIVTARLILRCWRPDDIAPYAAMNADDETMRYLGGTFDATATERLVSHLIGLWRIYGHGMWAIEKRETGEFLGRAGLYRAAGWPAPEMAWSLRRDHWGQGLATEAGAAALRYGFEVVGASRVISVIHPDNQASIRVAKRLGAAFTEIATIGAWKDSAVYEVTRETWTP
jgi:RimJ/RimL family protein N-acetyltransferase